MILTNPAPIEEHHAPVIEKLDIEDTNSEAPLTTFKNTEYEAVKNENQ